MKRASPPAHAAGSRMFLCGSVGTQTPGDRQLGARSAPALGLEWGYPHSMSPES